MTIRAPLIPSQGALLESPASSPSPIWGLVFLSMAGYEDTGYPSGDSRGLSCLLQPQVKATGSLSVPGKQPQISLDC